MEEVGRKDKGGLDGAGGERVTNEGERGEGGEDQWESWRREEYVKNLCGELWRDFLGRRRKICGELRGKGRGRVT